MVPLPRTPHSRIACATLIEAKKAMRMKADRKAAAATEVLISGFMAIISFSLGCSLSFTRINNKPRWNRSSHQRTFLESRGINGGIDFGLLLNLWANRGLS